MTDPLAALRQKFVARCAEDLEALSTPETDAAERRRVIHRIAGAAGMFGFSELGTLAGRLDDQAAEGQPPDEADCAALIDALKSIAGA